MLTSARLILQNEQEFYLSKCCHLGRELYQSIGCTPQLFPGKISQSDLSWPRQRMRRRTFFIVRAPDSAPTAAIAVAHLTIPKKSLSSGSQIIAEFDLRPFVEGRGELHQLPPLAQDSYWSGYGPRRFIAESVAQRKIPNALSSAKCETTPQSATFKPPMQIFEREKRHR